MKALLSHLATFMLCFLFWQVAQAENTSKYKLPLDCFVPKTGLGMEKLVFHSHISCSTNYCQGGQFTVTNLASSFELKFREKFLVWNESNSYAEVEILAKKNSLTRSRLTINRRPSLQPTFFQAEVSFCL